MKTLIALGACAALGGCMTSAPDRIDPKASYPNAGTGNVKVKDAGELVVFGPVNPRFREAKETLTPGNAGYVVYDEQGTRVAWLRESRITTDPDDFDVATLPPGRYLVRESTGRDPRAFWVTVERHGLTAVDVDTLRDLPAEEPRVAPVE